MNEKHLLLTARGTYVDSLNAAEVWQNAIRLALVFGTVDNEGTLPNNWSVDTASETVAVGGVSYDTNWIGSLGGGATFGPVSYLQDQAVPAWSACISGGTFSAKIKLTDLSLYPIGTNGNAVGGRSAHAVWDSGVVGGGNNDVLPLEVARVVSWQTPQLGRRGRGRIYLAGAVKADVGAAGEWTDTRAGAAGDAAQLLLETLAATTTGAGALQVRPIVTGTPYVNYGVITSINVGSVFDAQRRRRNRLVESRQVRTPSY